jgi:hypothetical protein
LNSAVAGPNSSGAMKKEEKSRPFRLSAFQSL